MRRSTWLPVQTTQTCSALLCLLLCATAHAEGSASLWRTPDQRAEAELRAGHAAAAAQLYTDPRRKAWAQLQAGDYRAAADSYASLSTPEAAYNRGNALVRAGDLQQALEAYNEALALNPDDADARRNRDLVVQALQGARPPRSSDRTASPAARGAGAGTSSPAASGAASPSAARAPSPPTATATPPTARNGAAPPVPPTGHVQTPAQSQPNPTPPDNAADRRPSPEGAGSDANNRPDDRPADSAVQAERDVMGATRSRSGLRTDRDTPPARTEQQLAQDQWLRRLPDDASGLLRRKFLIQHLIRQGSAP